MQARGESEATIMAESQKKEELYRLTRFKKEELEKLPAEISGYAKAIGGLPQNHKEVFEKRGWLLPFLFTFDDLLWKRWDYWTTILMKKTIVGSGPIPQIEWCSPHKRGAIETKKMLERCLAHHESNIDKFADWLLWGLASGDNKPQISERLNEHYYREFDLFLVLDNPTDYFSDLLTLETGRGYQSGLGYFPTPPSLTQLLTGLTLFNDNGRGWEEMKRMAVYDPCVGCGATLLPASNYMLRAYAQDISSIAIKLCKIQFYFYAPWYARPGEEVEGFDDDEESMNIIQNHTIVRTKKGRVSEAQLSFLI